jgi:hypothetical protein
MMAQLVRPAQVAPLPLPVPVAVQAPVVQAPVVQAPVVQAPVVQAPVVQTPAYIQEIQKLNYYEQGFLKALNVYAYDTLGFQKNNKGKNQLVNISENGYTAAEDYLKAYFETLEKVIKLERDQFKSVNNPDHYITIVNRLVTHARSAINNHKAKLNELEANYSENELILANLATASKNIVEQMRVAREIQEKKRVLNAVKLNIVFEQINIQQFTDYLKSLQRTINQFSGGRRRGNRRTRGNRRESKNKKFTRRH